MSLNGLDDPRVAEAHAAAVAESGCWFLLKYASRDEVEVLGRGTGGITELRDAVAAYDETNPLYGFLKYRRRKVLIKYLPEGCSRLIQARVAVHFNAVCEHFSPYDSSFEIATSDELKDSKLSAACSLHAASGSNSSSASSQRRKHLMEIAEEDEEESKPPKRQSILNEEDEEEDADLTPEPKVSDSDKRPKTAGDVSTTTEPLKLDADLGTSPQHSKFSAPTTSEVPNFVGAEDLSTADTGRRMSSQSGRAETIYSGYNYGKPKVKLGPRPSLDTTVRPQTAGNFRPVSSIPAGFKLFGKAGVKKTGAGSSTGGRKNSIGSINSTTSPQSEISEISFASTLPIPEEPNKPRADHMRPATSSGVSMKSNLSSRSAMTPEKARLKKAMQLREKKKKNAAKAAASAVAAANAAPDEPEDDPVAKAQKQDDNVAEEAIVDPQPEPVTVQVAEPAAAADSGIEIEASPASTKGDHSSERTQSDSQATSPIATTDPAQSTKASSVSESTDQTTQANADDSIDDKEDKDDTPQPKSPEEVEEAVAGDIPIFVDIPAAQPVPEAELAKDDEGPQVVSAEVEAALPEYVPPPAPEVVTAETEAALPEFVRPTTTDDALQGEEAKLQPDLAGVHEVEAVAKNREGSPAPVQVASYEDMSTQSQQMAELEAARKKASPGARELASEAPPPVPKLGMGAALQSKFTNHTSPPPAIQGVFAATEVIHHQALEDSDGETASTVHHQPVSKRRLQAASMQPIRTDLAQNQHQHPESRPTSQSELDFSDDDSLLEELQSATVEEAKPLFVAKTPLTPGFPSNVNAMMMGGGGGPSPSSPSLPPLSQSQSQSQSQSSSQERGTAAKPHLVRTVSNPVRGSLIAPPSDVSQSSARSLSQGGAAYLHRLTQQETSSGNANLSKKTNMGSRISQRIKALEQLSANGVGNGSGDVSPQPTSRPGSRPSSTFFSVAPGRTPSRSPSVMDRANSLSRQNPSSGSHSPSRESSPETLRPDRDRSGSMANRLSMFEPATLSASSSGGLSPMTTPRGRPESVQVTAKIMRDSGAASDENQQRAASQEPGHLDLRQSPLVVDHQTSGAASTTDEHESAASEPRESLLERRTSKKNKEFRSDSQEGGKESKSQRSSLSIVKDFIKDHRKSIISPSANSHRVLLGSSPDARSPSRPPPTHQNSSNSVASVKDNTNNSSNSFTRRLSIGSRRSLSRDRGESISPAALTEASASGDEAKEKKPSRTGRLMRRLSNLSSSRGKITSPTIGTPTVTEEATGGPILGGPSGADGSGTPAVVEDMGDVNVQFPDTLLWKRRQMCLDSHGYLILSASQSGTGAGGRPKTAAGVKRYHLSEFRPPYVPDVEVQELPNSVVLELLEGSSVQVACEDRTGQTKVLQILRDAHASYAGS